MSEQPTTEQPMPELLVPARFRGPASSGNGGWTAGAMAGLVPHGCPENRNDSWPVIEVTLRMPPPLDTAVPVSHADGVTTAALDGVPVASARVVSEDDAGLVDVDPVDPETARRASTAYPGLASHPFPTCFACGTGREEGDGLRIFPGPVAPVDGATRVAAPWTPHPSTSEDYHAYVDEHPRASLAVTWAALDCVGGWAGDLTDRLMVLGRMTARVDALPVIGEEHVVMGLGLGRDGRKTFTASTLYDADGRVVASARHTWIAIDPADFT